MVSCMKKVFLGSYLLFAASSGMALDPRAVSVGIFEVTPTVTVSAASNDNLFRTYDNQFSSTSVITNPNLSAVAQSGANIYQFDANLEDGRYQDSPTDDYTDWSLSGSAQIEVTSRNSLSLGANYLSTQETRGTGFSEGLELAAEPAKYEITDYNLGYQFGSDGSRGILTLGVGFNDVAYSNVQDDVFSRDRETLSLESGLAIRISPSTNLLLQYQHTKVDYLKDSVELLGTQDSEENYVYLGANWTNNSSLAASVLVGFGNKDYVSELRNDQDIPSWQASIDWQPLSYSSFIFTASNYFSEAAGVGDSIESNSTSVDWSHQWSDRINSIIGIQRENSDYGGVNRKDEVDSPTAELSYAFRRWLDISLSFSRELRDSSISSLNYSQKVYMLNLRASL